MTSVYQEWFRSINYGVGLYQDSHMLINMGCRLTYSNKKAAAAAWYTFSIRQSCPECLSISLISNTGAYR